MAVMGKLHQSERWQLKGTDFVARSIRTCLSQRGQRFSVGCYVSRFISGLRSMSLSALLLLAGVGFVGGQAAIAPPPVHAYTSRVAVLIDRRVDGDFDALLSRAEAAARAGVQRSFDQDILVTQAAVTIVAENNGSFVPILTLDVSRQQWKSFPDPQRWATYYRTAKSLLGFDTPIE